MRKNIKIGIITVIIFIAITSFAAVDFYKVKNNSKPIFCFIQNKLKDGGTVEYIGFGYKVIAFHRIEGVSSYYGGIHVAPLIIHTHQIYKSARGKEFVSLGKYDKELYNILAKSYERNELNELFKETRKYDKKIEKKYKLIKRDYLKMRGSTHISYKHGYDLVPPSNSEVKIYEFAIESYNNGTLDISDKTFLYDRIERFYKENKRNLDNETISKFEIFFYGIDYTKITY